jgi:hypothetical protein
MVESPRKKLNRLAKWRTVFAGWQLGTRAKGDPEADAVRDHRESSILLRVEVTALTRILLEKGIVSHEELDRIVGEEADHLAAMYERRFPGIRADDDGLVMDSRAPETMKGWRP